MTDGVAGLVLERSRPPGNPAFSLELRDIVGLCLDPPAPSGLALHRATMPSSQAAPKAPKNGT